MPRFQVTATTDPTSYSSASKVRVIQRISRAHTRPKAWDDRTPYVFANHVRNVNRSASHGLRFWSLAGRAVGNRARILGISPHLAQGSRENRMFNEDMPRLGAAKASPTLDLWKSAADARERAAKFFLAIQIFLILFLRDHGRCFKDRRRGFD